MDQKLTLPSKRFFRKADKIINTTLEELPSLSQDYYHINDVLTDDTPVLQSLIKQETGRDKFKISAGTSDMLAFKPYLDKAVSDLRSNTYYRRYNNPLGNTYARQALTIMENTKFNKEVYTYKNIGLMAGSTGGISQVFEYVKRENPSAEVVITSPTYYLYKYLAKYYQLEYREAFRISSKKQVEFDSIKDVSAKISPQTKLVILVQPNNPTNQLFSESDLKSLLLTSKKQNILVLVDELFSGLMYQDKLFTPSDLIAAEVGALENLVIVKGYSKSKNLASFRIGYLFSTNKKLMQAMAEISEQRQCFAGASNYTGLIILDSLIQTALSLADRGIKTDSVINKTKKLFESLGIPKEPTLAATPDLFNAYKDYQKRLLKSYSDYIDRAVDALGNEVEACVPKIVAFNTFVKIKDVDHVNYFDFCLNYYLCCNVVTQIGPCFAFSQARWQNDPSLGFWLRLSYSRENINRYLTALKMLIEFKNTYLSNPDKFLKTGLTF